MSRLNVSNLFNENEDGAPVVSGISTFSSPYYFVPPSGSTAQRPQDPGEGMIRFNTDSGHLEYYTGTHWVDVIVNNNELGGSLTGAATTFSTNGTGTRGVWSGGRQPAPANYTDAMDYITVETLGDVQDFGTLSAARAYSTSCASRTKGIVFGGAAPSVVNTIDKFIFSSTGSRGDFGDITPAVAHQAGGHSNETRGIFAGLAAPSFTDIIQYVTIASDGDSIDFGDLLHDQYSPGGCGSSVRGLFGLGYRSPDTLVDDIEYVTVSTTGNSLSFGELTQARRFSASVSNSTRGVWAGGLSPSFSTTMDFATIATTGNGQDFGDLLAGRASNNGGAASATRGIFGGGYTPQHTNSCEFITIPSTGNSVDFGDLNHLKAYTSACSNGHGGL